MKALYDKYLKICSKYITVNPQGFLDRQIKIHLNKEPLEVAPGDVEELAKWCKVSSSLLIGGEKAAILSEEILKS